MLTANLVRARMANDRVIPHYISVTSLQQRQRAEALIALFEDSIGLCKADLDEAIADHIGVQTDFLVQRGLVKLLMDRTDLGIDAPVKPAELRRDVFRLAATMIPITRTPDERVGTPRQKVLEQVAVRYGVDWTVVDAGLWADKPDAQRIKGFESVTPDELLQRYNTALAQGVLFKAETLTVDIEAKERPGKVRSLLRAIKFFGLIHRICQDPQSQTLRITLDGPLSLFQGNTRYGIQMANFLPVLLRLEYWALEAKVRWGDNATPAVFGLSPEQGLQSYIVERGSWQSDEERLLKERLETLEGPWTLVQKPHVLSLVGGDVAVPDLTLVHEDGRCVWVELLGYWRKASLLPRLVALQRAGVENYILVLSDRLRVDQDELESFAVPTLRYKGVISHKKLLELADSVPPQGDQTHLLRSL